METCDDGGDLAARVVMERAKGGALRVLSMLVVVVAEWQSGGERGLECSRYGASSLGGGLRDAESCFGMQRWQAVRRSYVQ
jgi:hypothetical protein